jgi:hypothetical protein
MDDIVRAALKKWPHVPACVGWLALDARGDWYMRDDRVQRAGRFPAVKGSRIEHEMLRAFIERNYDRTPEGDWFFQNGPQRVYVELEAAPWIWRLASPTSTSTSTSTSAATPAVTTHTGLPATATAAWLDERDRLFLDTDRGFGLVHSLDVAIAADALETGCWPLERLPFDAMPARFGFRLSPADAGVAGPAPGGH